MDCKIKFLVLLLSLTFHRISAGWTPGDNSYIPAIKSEVKYLVSSDFIGDPLLIQKIDTQSGYTTYYYPDYNNGAARPGTPVFRINSIDTSTREIVLEDGEDFLKWTQNKRVYVVLRKSENDSKMYNVFYAYVRGHNSTHPLVEFDQWDARGAPHYKVRVIGWTNCDRTFITPCMPADVSVPLQVVQEGSEYSDELFSGEMPSGSVLSDLKVALGRIHPGKVNVSSFISAQYMDSTYDLLIDLDYTPENLDFIRLTVGTVVYSLIALTSCVSPSFLNIVGISTEQVRPGALQSLVKSKKQILSKAMLKLHHLLGKLSAIDQEELESRLRTIEEESIEKLYRKGTTQTINEGKPARKRRSMKSLSRRRRQEEQVPLEQVPSEQVPPGQVPPEQAPSNPPGGDEVIDPFVDISEENYQIENLDMNRIRSQLKELIHKYGQNINFLQKEAKIGNITLPRTESERHNYLNVIMTTRIRDLMKRLAPAGHPAAIKLLLSSNAGKKIWNLILETAQNHLEISQKEGKTAIEEAFSQSIEEYEEIDDQNPMRKGGLIPGDVLAGLLKMMGLGGKPITGDFIDMTVNAPGEIKLTAVQQKKLYGAIMGDQNRTAGGASIGKDSAGVSFGNLVGAAAMVSKGQLVQIPNKEMESVVQVLQEHLGGPKNPFSEIVSLLSTMLSKGPAGLNSGILVGLLGVVDSDRWVEGTMGGMAALVESDIFTHIGWRTMDLSQHNLNHISDYEGHLPFLGFGNCAVDVTKLDYGSVQSLDQAMKFYLQIWRTDCVPQQKDRLRELLATGWIRIVSDGTVGIRSDLDLLWKRKLNKDEVELISLALELEGFSEAFVQNYKNDTNTNSESRKHRYSPLGEPISRSVDTLIEGTLRTIHVGQFLLPRHFVKLARNAIKTLKTAFTKLLQDYYRLKVCPTCSKYVILVAKNDLQFTFAGIQYFLTDLYSVDRPTPMAAFRDFYGRNAHIIAEKLQTIL